MPLVPWEMAPTCPFWLAGFCRRDTGPGEQENCIGCLPQLPLRSPQGPRKGKVSPGVHRDLCLRTHLPAWAFGLPRPWASLPPEI